MPISDLVSRKPVVILEDATLHEAAILMKREHIGTLVVVDDHHCVSGVITDRDIVICGVAEGRNSFEAQVGDLMRRPPVCVKPEEGIYETILLMRRHEIRRAVVVDENDKPLGVVSADRLMQLLGEEIHNIGQMTGRQASFEERNMPAMFSERPVE